MDMSNEAFEIVFDEMMNDIILEYSFQAHRAYKAGLFHDTAKVEKTEDIFGQVKGRIKMPNIMCPKCKSRKVEASRIASHLSDCMIGKGRASSRNATKKLNSTAKDEDEDSDNGEFENGSNSSYFSGHKKKSKKSSGQARKRNNPNILSLDKFCGATTKNTKKMCMNSKNCPQHPQRIQNNTGNYMNEIKEDVAIDVDTVDEVNNDVCMPQVISVSSKVGLMRFPTIGKCGNSDNS